MAPNSNPSARVRPFLDPAAASIYETIREHEEEYTHSDDDFPTQTGEARDNGMAIASPLTAWHRPRTDRNASETRPYKPGRSARQARHGAAGRPGRSIVTGVEEIEDDVPASLLIEDSHRGARSPISKQQRNVYQTDIPIPALHPEWSPDSPFHEPQEGSLPQHNIPRLGIGSNTMATATSREKAVWRWANVENLDNFLADVYDYYILKGFWSIVLRRLLNLLTVTFIIGFSLFLTQCIDYSAVKGSTRLDEIIVRRCTIRMGFIPNLILWLTAFICFTRAFQTTVDIRRLRRLHDFYLYLLDIPESEIQSISWQEVVSRLMALRDSHPNIRNSGNPASARLKGTQSKQRMDAHDIANRLMRKDNYMIAMINKDVLDFSLALPLIGRRQFFTRTLEWHLNYCIMDYVFNKQGQLRQLFLKDTHRKALSDGLKRRFIFAGTTSLLFAPFLIIYYIVQNFFQHFNEYQKDPAQIGSRQYNVFAQWKFREFNELWHLFDRRLKMSHPFAMRYINQFPKDKQVQAARFVTFVTGAIVSVLGLATILDQENFLGFEITSGRTTIFYLGVFGSIWAVARGMLPDENMIYDSSYSMEEVIDFTHYKPLHWQGRLHTVEVKAEFERLYQMQISILLEEILSMLFTPFVLWFSLPECSDRIIDFFREFTVNVDGLGYVCSFAEFNFKKPAQTGTGSNAGTRGNKPADVAAQARETEYYAAKDDKLEQSYYNFLNDYSRNPKADVRFSYLGRHRSRSYHPPPPVPGPPSPSWPRWQQDRRKGEHVSVGNEVVSQSGPEIEMPSPPQSLLLDPHHQPPTRQSTLLSPQTLRARAPFASTRSGVLPVGGNAIMSTVLREEDEEQEQDRSLAQPANTVKASQAGQSGGDLGSWKYDDDLEEESQEEDDPHALAQGGGVLGLIRQLQKVHGDDKRAVTSV